MADSPQRFSSGRPAWQLPRGVSPGTWDYVGEASIATEYDAYHGDHPLMRLDTQLLLERLSDYPADSSLVADFGCGTARIARLLQPLGYRTLNVDLSRHMLTTASAQLTRPELAACVHSNLVELDWLHDQVIDVSVCLFSSIGMIRGRSNRQAFLRHVRRTLSPGGAFLLHVHNRDHSWLDPHGPWWLLRTRLESLWRRGCEYGDRIYSYRGLPRMFLHIYSLGELRADLRAAGFERVDILPIDLTGSHLIPQRTPALPFRAGGFFAWSR
ncbi:MAG: class I SAM-dependent methyltransferase [Aureliella sp.]